jgi:hypothetical protein
MDCISFSVDYHLSRMGWLDRRRDAALSFRPGSTIHAIHDAAPASEKRRPQRSLTVLRIGAKHLAAYRIWELTGKLFLNLKVPAVRGRSA